MIQFNLLPDVKLAYIKAARTRRLVTLVSVFVTLIALLIFGALIGVTILQRHHLADIKRDIASENLTLSHQKDLDKILTVQNQLNSLTSLHAAKPATNRLADYLNQITPAKANIDNLQIDFNQHTVTVTGTADALSTVNQYVDTLKFTTYTAAPAPQAQAFSNVVLTTFGLSKHEASYTINFVYDPTIFDITKTIQLTVPNKVTTRSQTSQPTDLFKLPVDQPATTSTTTTPTTAQGTN